MICSLTSQEMLCYVQDPLDCTSYITALNNIHKNALNVIDYHMNIVRALIIPSVHPICQQTPVSMRSLISY